MQAEKDHDRSIVETLTNIVYQSMKTPRSHMFGPRKIFHGFNLCWEKRMLKYKYLGRGNDWLLIAGVARKQQSAAAFGYH